MTTADTLPPLTPPAEFIGAIPFSTRLNGLRTARRLWVEEQYKRGYSDEQIAEAIQLKPATIKEMLGAVRPKVKRQSPQAVVAERAAAKIRLPEAPFAIERNNSDYAAPSDRRSAYGAAIDRPMPKGNARAALFRQMLIAARADFVGVTHAESAA